MTATHSPTLATALYAAGGTSTPVTVYLVAVSLLSLGCLALAARDARTSTY